MKVLVISSGDPNAEITALELARLGAQVGYFALEDDSRGATIVPEGEKGIVYHLESWRKGLTEGFDLVICDHPGLLYKYILAGGKDELLFRVSIKELNEKYGHMLHKLGPLHVSSLMSLDPSALVEATKPRRWWKFWRRA